MSGLAVRDRHGPGGPGLDKPNQEPSGIEGSRRGAFRRAEAAERTGERRLTGAHVAAMFVAGFGIIVAVNAGLAVSAVRTFPGLETDSSYVASQTFDADRAAQDALHWDVGVTYVPGRLTLAVEGPDGPVRPEIAGAVLGRATHVADDREPAFVWDGAALVAPADLGPGNWNLRLDLRAEDGTVFRRRVPLRVAG